MTTVPYDGLGDKIIFRKRRDRVWQVELHRNDRGFPSGIAWVHPGTAEHSEPYVMYIFVVDDQRREGIATKLTEICLKRWPDLWLTGAISDAGEALYNKFCDESDTDTIEVGAT